MVVAGVNVNHKEFCELAKTTFGSLKDIGQSELTVMQPASYKGGNVLYSRKPVDGFTHFIIGFETGVYWNVCM